MVKIKVKYIPTQEMIFLASKLAETSEGRKIGKIRLKKKKKKINKTKVKWKK